MHREAAGARPTLDAVDVDAGRVDHPQLLGKLQRPTSGNGLAQGSEQGIVDASQPEVLTIRKLRLRLVLAQLFPPGRRHSHGHGVSAIVVGHVDDHRRAQHAPQRLSVARSV